MAVGVLTMVPGGTAEQYEQIGEKLFGVRSSDFDPATAPDGLIVHTAGPTDEGWYTYDVWESSEKFQAFAERLREAGQELGAPEPAGPPQFYEIYNLVQAG